MWRGRRRPESGRAHAAGRAVLPNRSHGWNRHGSHCRPEVTVNYSGWLYDPTRPENKGTGFDAQNGARFQIGVGMVIAGWDRGVPGMRVGGIRRLVVPPELGYGAAGRGPVPPNATMVFDIELVAVQ